MKQFLVCVSLLAACFSSCTNTGSGKASLPETKTLSKEVLMDKIKGGWAGQTIGCTYGGPTEFEYRGSMIQDYVKIRWTDTLMKWWFENAAWLYDDVYMDATFVNVFDRVGLDAPVDSFANAFAYADYGLWHANQAARYNLLQGIKAPESGNWKHNIHADDIDFQIEADFAGLMAPGMVNSATAVCDKIGHIMNSGDGYYGGVYIASMYALAFVSDDIEFVVTEALKAIPAESEFHQCISDAIRYSKKYPTDWKQTWFELQKKWTEDRFCGVFDAYNIDAKINAAYIVMGLLYGKGDFTETMDISMRCGLDSDCNPANAAGILGTMIGYNKIPQQYLTSTKMVEKMDFDHAHASLEDLYRMSFDQALGMIQRGGGSVSDSSVTIKVQQPVAVPFEVSFPGLYPVDKFNWKRREQKVENFTFTGTGIVVNGGIQGPSDYVAEVDLIVDGKVAEHAILPAHHLKHRNEISFVLDLPNGDHSVTLKWLNPTKDAKLVISDIVTYGPAPATAAAPAEKK